MSGEVMNPWKFIDSFPDNYTDLGLIMDRPCPVCGCDKGQEFLIMPDFQFFSDSAEQPKRVDIRQVQCQECFALYLNPAYSQKGFEVLFAEAGCSYGATTGRADEQLEWLKKRGLLDEKRILLDVGCYEGEFLEKIPNTVRRIGVDIDGPAIERGRRTLGKDVLLIQGDFNRVQLPETPDTITLFHVLEHLPDPVSTLMNLRRQASEKTRLVVEVPILENGFTNDINGFLSVQHMTHFSRASLKNILERSGWVIEERLEQTDYNGCRTLCRPSDMRAEVDPAAADPISLADYLKHYRNMVNAVSENLSSLPPEGHIVVWGGGLHTEFLYHCTDLFKISGRDFIIVDKDPLKAGKSWRGISIHGTDILHHTETVDAALVISSYGNQKSIYLEAVEKWRWQGKIVELYDEINVY